MFKEFMEQYMRCLTDTRGLTEMLAEAKVDYRVQKLLVPYLVKDRETFLEMSSLACYDNFAKKLMDHCAGVFHDLMTGKTHDRDDMKDLVSQLDRVSGFLNQSRPDTTMDPWEFAGYTDTLNRFLLEAKMAKVDEDESMSEQLKQLKKELDEMAASAA